MYSLEHIGISKRLAWERVNVEYRGVTLVTVAVFTNKSDTPSVLKAKKWTRLMTESLGDITPELK